MSMAVNTREVTLHIKFDSFMLFIYAIWNAEIDERLSIFPFDVNKFLLLLTMWPNVPCFKQVRVVPSKAAKSKQQLKNSMLLGKSNFMLDDIRTKQVRQ